MRVQDFTTTTEVNNAADLVAALARRSSQNANEFWLSTGNKKYPAMTILAKGDLATLSYLTSDQEPGFRSVGNINSLDPNGFTTFFINKTEEHEVLNDAVLPFAQAVEAALEFMRSGAMPSSLEWFEL
jgi:hypothetical protein